VHQGAISALRYHVSTLCAAVSSDRREVLDLASDNPPAPVRLLYVHQPRRVGGKAMIRRASLVANRSGGELVAKPTPFDVTSRGIRCLFSNAPTNAFGNS
jgi:hypothetical protein